MSLAVGYARALHGIDAPEVTVEVHLARGLPGLSLVGLAEKAVSESKDRVRSALVNAGFEFPQRRITINLAPADLPKEGGRFDLVIALGVLAASGQLPAEALLRYEFAGELALSGGLRPVGGVLPAALRAREAGRALMVPQANADEAALVDGLELYAADHLTEVCDHLAGRQRLVPYVGTPHRAEAEVADLADVRGQHHARRALTIAAAGEHSLLMIGPPGTGKTMLASRLPGILPPMSDAEALEAAAIHSVSRGGFDPACWRQRPYRAPHHTASGVALVGGGSIPRPGEVSLATHGALFLDELPEFERKVLEVLREPLESGSITISRAARQAEFPARFQLVAAMNPCPCGYLGHPSGRCHCTAEQIQRYRARISGPLLDRIDLQVEVPPLPRALLLQQGGEGESSAVVRERVVAARARQLRRAGCANGRLQGRQLEQHCALDGETRAFFEQATERVGLSARSTHRVLKVARTIADLDEAPAISTTHLAEAIQFRALDRSTI